MNVRNITQTEIEHDWQWLFESVTSCLDKIAILLTQNDVTVPCIPKRVAGYLVPYSFCGQILLLLDYVKDKRTIAKTLVEDVTTQFYQIMTMNVATFIQNPNDDDDDDDDVQDSLAQTKDDKYAQMLQFIESMLPHPTAAIILAANGKLKLSRNQWLSSAEMYTLTGISPDIADQLNIPSRIHHDRTEFSPEHIQNRLNHNDDLDE